MSRGAPSLSTLGPLALALLTTACPSGGADRRARDQTGATARAEPAMPGPAPRARTRDAAAHNAECESCHPDIADEWRRSLHRQAYSDIEFQRAFKREPMPFCRGCHAPEADPSRPPPADAGALGVGCVTCHVVKDDILAAPLEPGTADANIRPHEVLRAPTFASPAACAGCHEFPFPGRGPARELMQRTIHEHATSPASERSCAACHMPQVTAPGAPGERHRSHAFVATRSRDQLRAALKVSARRVDPRRVELTLTAGDVGHAVPTGDINRRLSVWTRVLDPARRRPRDVRYLARHLRPSRGPGGLPSRAETSDDRVFPDAPVRVVFELAEEDAALPVEWSVAHQRVEFFLSKDEHSGVVAGEVVIDAGRLEPRPS